DSDEALVGSANKQVLQWSGAIPTLLRCAVDGAILVASKALNRHRGESVAGHDAGPKVADKSYRRLDHPRIPRVLGGLIFRGSLGAPAIVVGQGRDANHPLVERLGV